jgi:AAA domain-containing protein
MSVEAKEEVGIILPKTKIEASRRSPQLLIIFAPPKVGKTTAVAGLEDYLILDFDKGTDFLSSLKIKVESPAHLRQIGTEIIKQGRPYKGIVVDTITVLEDFSKGLALKLYMQTPIGKNYQGNDVLQLPNGAGYQYLRTAFFQILDYIKTLADNVILVAHQKDKLIEIAGKEVSAKAVDLTGKLASLVCADADAIALMSRKDNQTFLNFKTSDTIICGARPEHLRGQEIVISELKEDGTIETFWNKVYID